jgi:threonine synthase
LDASSILSRNTGLFAEPASSCAFAGYLKYLNNHQIEENSNVMVLLTGSGLKDLKSLNKFIKMPQSIYPGINELCRLIDKEG